MWDSQYLVLQLFLAFNGHWKLWEGLCFIFEYNCDFGSGEAKECAKKQRVIFLEDIAFTQSCATASFTRSWAISLVNKSFHKDIWESRDGKAYPWQLTLMQTVFSRGLFFLSLHSLTWTALALSRFLRSHSLYSDESKSIMISSSSSFFVGVSCRLLGEDSHSLSSASTTFPMLLCFRKSVIYEFNSVHLGLFIPFSASCVVIQGHDSKFENVIGYGSVTSEEHLLVPGHVQLRVKVMVIFFLPVRFLHFFSRYFVLSEYKVRGLWTILQYNTIVRQHFWNSRDHANSTSCENKISIYFVLDIVTDDSLRRTEDAGFLWLFCSGNNVVTEELLLAFIYPCYIVIFKGRLDCSLLKWYNRLISEQ